MAGCVILANPRGFCAGVRRALETIEAALAHADGALYCLHEIVHNRHVVESLASRGVRFVPTVADVPAGGRVIFSAHGVAPTVRREAAARGLRVIDATCPFVAKVHAEVRRYAAAGLTVVVIGNRGHDEIVGVVGEAGEAGGRVVVVENEREARALDFDGASGVAVVTQTTWSVEETGRVMAVLLERFPRLLTPSRGDICHATSARQDAVRRLAARVARVLVLGSNNSSNTQRLAAVARAAGAQAWLLDSAESVRALCAGWGGEGEIGVTAGASTPEPFIAEVMAVLATLGFSRVEELSGGVEEGRLPLPPEVGR